MREAPTAQNVSGGMPSQSFAVRRRAVGAWVMLAVIAAICMLAGDVYAQQRDPSMALPPLPKNKSAFPKKDLFNKNAKLDKAAPLYLQADKLTYDDKNNRVIAQGNVEIYYNNYILTADKVVYD